MAEATQPARDLRSDISTVASQNIFGSAAVAGADAYTQGKPAVQIAGAVVQSLYDHSILKRIVGLAVYAGKRIGLLKNDKPSSDLAMDSAPPHLTPAEKAKAGFQAVKDGLGRQVGTVVTLGKDMVHDVATGNIVNIPADGIHALAEEIRDKRTTSSGVRQMAMAAVDGTAETAQNMYASVTGTPAATGRRSFDKGTMTATASTDGDTNITAAATPTPAASADKTIAVRSVPDLKIITATATTPAASATTNADTKAVPTKTTASIAAAPAARNQLLAPSPHGV